MRYHSRPTTSRNGLCFTVAERNAAMDSFMAMALPEGSEVRRKVATANYRLHERIGLAEPPFADLS